MKRLVLYQVRAVLIGGLIWVFMWVISLSAVDDLTTPISWWALLPIAICCAAELIRWINQQPEIVYP